MIYLDNAATSGKKPDTVLAAVQKAFMEANGNPGRSGHQVSLRAGQLVQDARLKLARLFNAENANRIVFTMNATDALNEAILGLDLREGSHIITSSMEHNSVSRVLHHLAGQGASVTKLPSSIDSGVDPEAVRRAITGRTRLVVMNHVSNVTGTVTDIGSIGRICREAGVPFLADVSQSAGSLPIDVQRDCIDLLAFPGHKSLLGPQGTGGLYIRPGIPLLPLRRGGTGSLSELQEQPESMPDRYESGTLNVPGIAGLGAGIAFLLSETVKAVRGRESALMERLTDGLLQIPQVTVYSPKKSSPRGSVLSFTIRDIEVQYIALLLDEAFGIAVRGGLHCAPDAHATIGTLKTGGTIRVSPGYFTSEEEIDACIRAVADIAKSI